MHGRNAYLQCSYLWHPEAGVMAEPEPWPPGLEGSEGMIPATLA
jgi:hypothetical protein